MGRHTCKEERERTSPLGFKSNFFIGYDLERSWPPLQQILGTETSSGEGVIMQEHEHMEFWIPEPPNDL